MKIRAFMSSEHKIMADLYVDDKAGNVATIIKLANAADFKRG